MKVKRIYQDDYGQWHIEYSWGNFIDLALRVYIGQIIITIPIALSILFISLSLAKSPPAEHNIFTPSNSNVPQESIDNDMSN